MLSRGKATSGAPICSGMIALAHPAKAGVAKSSSMIRPCIVKSWLYCSLVCTTCRPGENSSALMISAMRPASMKKPIEEIRYRCPIVLWSVVMSHRVMVEPLRVVTGAAWACSSVTNAAVMSLAPGAVDAVGRAAGDGPGARRRVAAAEVGVERPDVALAAQLLDVGVELGLRNHPDVEEHLGVVLAAELGALALVGPDLLGHDLELVPHPRDDVQLVEEGGDPERVDDVPRRQLELHAPPDRQVERRQLRLDAGLARQLALDPDLVDVERLAVLLEVVEVPRPLLADHVDGHVGLGRDVGDRRLVARGEEEEHRDHDEWDHSVHDRERQVVPDLRGQAGLAPAPPIGEDAPDDEAPDEETDQPCRDPRTVPERDDPPGLVGRGGGRGEPPGLEVVTASGEEQGGPDPGRDHGCPAPATALCADDFVRTQRWPSHVLGPALATPGTGRPRTHRTLPGTASRRPRRAPPCGRV